MVACACGVPFNDSSCPVWHNRHVSLPTYPAGVVTGVAWAAGVWDTGRAPAGIAPPTLVVRATAKRPTPANNRRWSHATRVRGARTR